MAKKGVVLGWDESRFSHYDIRADGALPPSITVIARVKHLAIRFAIFLIRELILNLGYMAISSK